MPLYLPRKIAAQPQGRARVDFSNPLADCMTFAWTASNGFYDSVSPSQPTIDVNRSSVVNGRQSSRGVVQETSVDSASISWGTNNRAVNKPNNPYTVGAIFQIKNLGGTNIEVFGPSNIGTAYAYVGFTTTKAQVVINKSGGAVTVQSDANIAVGDWINIVAVIKEGSQDLYINGIKQVNAGTATSILPGTVQNYVEINPSRCRLLSGFVSTRPWTQAEVTSWNNNPWQIFMPTGVVFLPTGTAPPVTTANTFQSFSRGVGRGIARGIA